ncbi:DsbA family protein [Phycicoccus avicenniae]|uniref:mycothiol-dependent nitroreductase Rv2466c family protein n=1 Tax=Phycicoccus avicenniae TaxID=2828860 RepID=UPI003D2C1D85
MPTEDVVVDLWFDPVCPYSWTASRWLHEVRALRPVTVHHHVMSLYLLNEHRTDVEDWYRRSVEESRGPARVAAAAAARCGEEVLGDLYTAFGEVVFDVWRRPSAAEYRAALEVALPRVGLPADLVDAMDDGSADEALRASHDAGLALAGGDVGTPVTAVDGAGFHGPVLDGVPRGEDAVELFEGLRLVTRRPEFYELKRTRTRPPALT